MSFSVIISTYVMFLKYAIRFVLSCKCLYALHRFNYLLLRLRVLFIRLKETVLYCLGLEPNISKCKHLILAKQRKSVSDYKILDLVHSIRYYSQALAFFLVFINHNIFLIYTKSI